MNRFLGWLVESDWRPSVFVSGMALVFLVLIASQFVSPWLGVGSMFLLVWLLTMYPWFLYNEWSSWRRKRQRAFWALQVGVRKIGE